VGQMGVRPNFPRLITSKRTLYNHFQSKEALFQAVIRHRRHPRTDDQRLAIPRHVERNHVPPNALGIRLPFSYKKLIETAVESTLGMRRTRKRPVRLPPR